MRKIASRSAIAFSIICRTHIAPCHRTIWTLTLGQYLSLSRVTLNAWSELSVEIDSAIRVVRVCTRNHLRFVVATTGHSWTSVVFIVVSYFDVMICNETIRCGQTPVSPPRRGWQSLACTVYSTIRWNLSPLTRGSFVYSWIENTSIFVSHRVACIIDRLRNYSRRLMAMVCLHPRLPVFLFCYFSLHDLLAGKLGRFSPAHVRQSLCTVEYRCFVEAEC